MGCLDTGSVPAATGGDFVGAGGAAVHNVDAKESRGEEEDGCQKEECKVCFEFIAAAISGDAIPIPNATAVGADVVCKQTECDHEASKEQEVHGPVKEAGHEWEEEEEREQDADCGNNFSVDEALLVPC